MKNIKGKLISIGIILALVFSMAGIYSFIKLYDGEWICITQECSLYAEGNEWVKQNCNLNGSEMICEFQLEKQNFRVPLGGINVSNMVSCAEYECVSEVFVRGIKK